MPRPSMGQFDCLTESAFIVYNREAAGQRCEAEWGSRGLAPRCRSSQFGRKRYGTDVREEGWLVCQKRAPRRFLTG